VSLISQAKKDAFTWRIDLGHTEKHWPGWFKGLSAKFLELPVDKMLLLAGIDRLDKELTVGQMQGMFQILDFVAILFIIFCLIWGASVK